MEGHGQCIISNAACGAIQTELVSSHLILGTITNRGQEVAQWVKCHCESLQT